MTFEFKGVENMFEGGFAEAEKNAVADALIQKMIGKYEMLGAGRCRMAFKLKSGNYVVKVPLSENGEDDNCVESSKQDFGHPVAKARMVVIDGLYCAVMEYVEHYEGLREDTPEWTDFVDCGQFGYTKKGEMVAYDFGFY